MFSRWAVRMSVHRNVKGVFAGAGSDGLNEAEICNTVIALANTVTPPSVLYLGTATYDLPGPRARQTQKFVEAGCEVSTLELVDTAPSAAELKQAVDAANVILVSGGNTLFAVDRWTKLGLHVLLQAALERGAVLAGGSAGAICWFDSGHSDSADPDSFKQHMLRGADVGGDESSAAPGASAVAKEWEYIRVPGLGFLPGLMCPHHDKVQSNGVLRAEDFDRMLLRHPGERGIGIDHWAALVLDGETFRVIALQGREGSVLPDGSFSSERAGAPGVWIKEVRDGKVVQWLCPSSGKIKDLLRPASQIVEDVRVADVRRANPDA